MPASATSAAAASAPGADANPRLAYLTWPGLSRYVSPVAVAGLEPFGDLVTDAGLGKRAKEVEP